MKGEVKMKRILFLLMFVVLAIPAISLAESDVVDLIPIPEATPAPEKMPDDPRPVEIREHDLNEKDVERIARLIWGSPAKQKQSKVLIVWCVMNRLNDKSGMFGDTIETVVTKSEFGWFSIHDHRSEENLKIVRDTMNQWLTWKEGGTNVGRHPSGKVMYLRSSEEDHSVLEGSEHISPWQTLPWVS